MEIVTVPTVRNLHSALNPAIKSLNYLNNILAKIEANNAGCEEAIMLNAEGFVAECTGDNLFIVKKGQLMTPPLSAGALYGITRSTVMELATEMGLKVAEPNLTRYDLFNADECFLTGTGAEIVPVVKIDGRVIGTGKPGPLTRQLVKRVPRLDESLGRADIRLENCELCCAASAKKGSHGAFDPDRRGQNAEGGPVRRVRQDQGRK